MGGSSDLRAATSHTPTPPWKTSADADAFAKSTDKSVKLPDGARLRQVRVVRDYGMFDRREAPQYYPAVERLP